MSDANTQEYSNVVASSSEPDVISLSDEEGNGNLEFGARFAFLEQVSKILMTFGYISSAKFIIYISF